MSISIHQDEYAKLHGIAKTKKDGIYTRSGYRYSVKNGQLVCLVDAWGNVGLAGLIGGALISQPKIPSCDFQVKKYLKATIA